MNTVATVMFTNDVAVIPLGAVTAFILWSMVRSGRHRDFKMWLRAGAIGGLCIASKLSGVVLLGTYTAVAIFVCFDYLYKRKYQTALKILMMASVGTFMMLVPYQLNTWHQSQYIDNPFGEVNSEARSGLFETVKIPFFTTFDTTFFNEPFSWRFGIGPGTQSYWSIQYVTLHSDYYNH